MTAANCGDERILLAHGGGGQLTFRLLKDVILPALGGQDAHSLTDAARVDAPAGALAFTTDTYVVSPLEFPGGDIGKLAVCGTINDLAVSGARPLALSMGLVMEEGLSIALLARLMKSAGETAREAGVAVVTGDTKVVERGRGDGLYINTAGIGVAHPRAAMGYDRIRAGDALLLSGPLGEHGLAVMAHRKGLSFATNIRSDCASLDGPCLALVESLGESLRFMRDLTRGGLSGALVEIASSSRCSIEIEQADVAVTASVRAACELLGLDALDVANEGKFLAVVDANFADEALALLRKDPLCRRASRIGVVSSCEAEPLVRMVTVHRGRRLIQMPHGEDLPRIC